MYLDYLQAINLAIRANENSPLNKKDCGKYTSKLIHAKDHRSIWLDFGRCTEKTKAIQELCKSNKNYIGITKIRNVDGLHHYNTKSISRAAKTRLPDTAEIVFIDEPYMFTESELESLYEYFCYNTIFVHMGRPRYVGNQGC